MDRQVFDWIERVRAYQQLKYGCQDEKSQAAWLEVLVKELGEVAGGLLAANVVEAWVQTVSVAAVAVGWLEAVCEDEDNANEIQNLLDKYLRGGHASAIEGIP